MASWPHPIQSAVSLVQYKEYVKHISLVRNTKTSLTPFLGLMIGNRKNRKPSDCADQEFSIILLSLKIVGPGVMEEIEETAIMIDRLLDGRTDIPTHLSSVRLLTVLVKIGKTLHNIPAQITSQTAYYANFLRTYPIVYIQ